MSSYEYRFSSETHLAFYLEQPEVEFVVAFVAHERESVAIVSTEVLVLVV